MDETTAISFLRHRGFIVLTPEEATEIRGALNATINRVEGSELLPAWWTPQVQGALALLTPSEEKQP